MRSNVDDTVYNTIYYCEFMDQETSNKLKSTMNITDTHKHTNFNLSIDKIFFWDRYKIWMHDIDGVWSIENKEIIDFSISRCEKETYIKEVRTSTNPLTIAIIVSMS